MDVLLAEMTAEQLGEWAEFFDLEPWGTPHEDLRFGLLLNQQHDMNRDRKKTRRLDPWDWLPSCKPEGPREDVTRTPEGQHHIAGVIVAQIQAVLERDRRRKGA